MVEEDRRNVRFLNEGQAAERLGISKAMLAKLRKAGRIRVVRISSMIRYREEDLSAFYESAAELETPAVAAEGEAVRDAVRIVRQRRAFKSDLP